MTTFTRVEGDEATISIDVDRKLSPINPNIYGGFTEHMGRCIYGGIYDPGNPLSDEDGFRKDVIEALRDLKVPVVRYPGGNFVATYHWEDGIGPRENRPSRPELAWLGVETNAFGTDEFMKWCKVIGTEPYLCLNFGTGTLDEAINWLEYCNGTRKTHYANLRRRNGHEEPYNVKYWALGNEVWGPWQVGQLSKEDYAKKAFQWGKALKLIDPNIELILCGETGHSSWDYYVLQQAISVTSMHSIHIYSIGKDHLANATAPLCAERSIEMTASFIDLARIENKIPQSVPRQTVCFDEWNVWDPERAVGSEGAEERYSISDMVAVGVWLNVFVRQSKYLGMANIAQTVNVISPLMTSKEGIRKQSTWWPLWLFSNYMHGHTLGVHLSCDAYDGPTQPEWIRGTIDTPWLDVSASLSDDRWVSLVVVNIRSDRSVEVDLKGLTSDGEVVVYTVMDESEDALEQRPAKDAKLTESKWDGKGKYSFGKHSVTMLRWKHTS